MQKPAVRATSLRLVVPSPGGEIVVLDDVTVTLLPGELVALKGAAGSGKSSLLKTLAHLMAPTAGKVDLPRSDALETASIFQEGGLIPFLTAAENVEVPLRIRRVPARERDSRVRQALHAVGLSAHTNQLPSQLSGGQQQRVGIARALVSEPSVLFADEPTAQLDPTTAGEIAELILRDVRTRDMCALVATHDPEVIARADRLLELRDGVITEAPITAAATADDVTVAAPIAP